MALTSVSIFFKAVRDDGTRPDRDSAITLTCNRYCSLFLFLFLLLARYSFVNDVELEDSQRGGIRYETIKRRKPGGIETKVRYYTPLCPSGLRIRLEPGNKKERERELSLLANVRLYTCTEEAKNRRVYCISAFSFLY